MTSKDTEWSKILPDSFKNSFYEGWAIATGKFDGVKVYYAASMPGKKENVGKVRIIIFSVFFIDFILFLPLCFSTVVS